LLIKAIDYRKLNNKTFEETIVNEGNIFDLLGLSNENYNKINITLAEETTVATIQGKGKWKGLVACGTYQNMKVVESTSECNTDVVSPVITMNGDNPINIFIGETYKDAGATALDDVDGNLTDRITVTGTVNTLVPGTYTITYYVIDNGGNEATETRTITIIDNVPPTITFVPDGNNTYAKERIVTINVTDLGIVDNNSLKYVWTTSELEPSLDDLKTSFTNNQTVSTPSDVTGSYYLWVIAKDTKGNETIKRSELFNLDNTAPVITLTGINPVTINAGSTYSDAGATASDAHSGISGNVIVTGIVNVNVIGTYTVTYAISDKAGNEAVSVTRTINVVDNSAPTVAFGTNGNSTYAKNRNTTVTVSDTHSAIDISSLKYQWSTNTTTPSEASFSTTFTNGGTISSPAGVTGGYYLWILAKDTKGNTTIIRTNVFNLDNTAPVITMSGTTPVTISVDSSYNDAGATAADAHSGINGSVIVTGTVNINTVGTYTITYTVSDNAGNTATPVTRTINVISTITDFAFTGSVQTIVVPQAVTKAQIEVWGGQGGGDQGGNASGGYAKGTFEVTPGQTLYIYVGSKPTGSAGGFNGGGNGGRSAYGGGGATDVRLNGTSLTDRIIVAGGGGGFARWTDGYGGAGGGGYYGGGGGNGDQYSDSTHCFGGSGSGYIKAGATNTEMKTGGRSGHGAARIYFVSDVSEYAYTGTVKQKVINTSKVQIEVWGAQGGGDQGLNASGGYAKGVFNVTPGQTVFIYVGGKPTGSTGGFNGGGNGGRSAYGGGGATDVRLNGTSLTDRIIVAGGGGGFARWTDGYGGAGGGTVGNSGSCNGGAGGGSQTAGGVGGNVSHPQYGGGYSGSLGQGGNGGTTSYDGGSQGGGGGGGGYYGGGGGNGGQYSDSTHCSGGGGSGYIKTGAVNTEMKTGVQSGHGYVRITDIP
jgi:hypothetical protein